MQKYNDRSEVEEKYKWDLSDFYKNDQEYNKSLMDYFKVDETGFKKEVKFGNVKVKKVLGKKINGINVYNNIKYISKNHL